MSDDKQTIEIEESEVESQPVEITEENTSRQEFELAKKHGLVKEPKEETKDELKVEPVIKTDDNQDKKEEVKDELPTFEQVEEKEDLVNKFNKNEKALYWKWKTDKQKRQSVQKEKEDLQSDYEHDKLKFGVYKARQEKLQELLNNSTELTVEQIKQVLEEGKINEVVREKRPEVDVMREKIQLKANYAEKIGQAKYDNFQEIASLAKEVADADKTKTYQTIIDGAFTNDQVDENMLAEQIVNIAKLSPKFATLIKSVSPEDKQKADKIIANTNKKVSSASITGGGGKRVVSEDELTADDAVRLSSDQWRKLSAKTKERILKG